MLIAQITDLHLGAQRGVDDEPNEARLRQVLDRLFDGPNRPAALLVTGDLADRGAPESYARLKALMADCPVPWHPIPGNHDDRTHLSRAFPDLPTPGGYLQYVVDLGDVRVVMLDTLEIERHGGAFCEVRAAWLRERLDEATDVPVVLAMHHPPIDAGIDWMRTSPRDPWAERLAEAIAGRDQVKAIVCGHLHRPVAASWRGVPVSICPSTAPGLALDFRPTDPDDPDQRAMTVEDAPGFALHWWNGGGLVSHFERVEEVAVAARFEGKMVEVVREMLEEQAA